MDKEGNLAGIVTRSDVIAALEDESSEGVSLLSAGSAQLITAYPDELLHDTVTRMLSYDVGRVLIVDRNNPKKLLGYVGRSEILKSRLKRLDEERVRESGWLRRST